VGCLADGGRCEAAHALAPIAPEALLARQGLRLRGRRSRSEATTHHAAQPAPRRAASRGWVKGKPRRWKAERTNSWHNRFRGLLIRWEVKACHYEALCLLGSAVIAFRTSIA
jgi:hypothetical protein